MTFRSCDVQGQFGCWDSSPSSKTCVSATGFCAAACTMELAFSGLPVGKESEEELA